jgi:hypothetical protein
MKPKRMQMVHNMVVNYGLYKHMDVVVSGAERGLPRRKALYQSDIFMHLET